jgi:hypothetical protein
MEKKYKNVYELKQIIKSYSRYLKYVRLTRKQKHDPNFDTLATESFAETIKLLHPKGLTYKLRYANDEYMISCKIRHLFIAYGILRGKEYSVIESPKKDNALTSYDWEKINALLETFKMEEVISEKS